MRRFLRASVAAAVLTAMVAAPATAGTIFQSIPDLSAEPFAAGTGFCSPCAGSFRVFSQFTLASAATVESVAFNVATSSDLPQTINVSIWSQAAGLPDTEIFGDDFAPASFVSTVSTPFDTLTISVNTGGWALAAGTYDISFFGEIGLTSLAMPIYSSPGSRFFQSGLGGNGASPDFSTGFRLSDTVAHSSVPHPATWTMVLIGVAGLGIAARRRKGALAV